MTAPTAHPQPQPQKATISKAHDAVLAHHSAGSIGRFTFPAGTVLFEKGEVRHCAFLIDRGTVHIEGNDEGGEDRLLCVLGEGEIFGEMALVDSAPRTARAVTATECDIFVIPRDALQERVRGLDPVITMLIGLLIERYRFSRLHLPESIRQDQGGEELIKKISKYDRLPDTVMQLRDSARLREAARRELGLEQELRAGIENREFVAVLQPVMNLSDGRIAGFEALIRWHHPEKGLVMPNDFIPAAERTGIVQHLDRMMLDRACEILPQLRQLGSAAEKLFISVNMSGINFGVADVLQTVKNILAAHDADPACIKLEVTESALIGDPEAAENTLNDLRALGLETALDDFGTGYSSLSYLHRFAFDTIKIDRAFVMGLNEEGSRSVDIVRAVIALARNFGLSVVAEGVEEDEDAQILKALGCDMAQGYLYSKPLPVEDALAFTRKNLGL
jgi:EAL domain-containing protein (putative c-di-GMP-specific phosphodiesterase class I)/CRP-like cAMP-binding protein